MWVMHRVKSAAIGRGLVKSASLYERTINNPVRFAVPSHCKSLAHFDSNDNNN